MTAHQPPFFCPYCGEEDLRPHGESHGEWSFEACRRVFALRAVRPGAGSRTDKAAEVNR